MIGPGDQGRGDLVAAAQADGGAAEQGEPDVAANPGGHLSQFLLAEAGAPQLVAGHQSPGRVRAAAGQAGGDRIRFLISMARPGASLTPGPTASTSAATARAARLLLSAGTLRAPSPVTTTLSVSAEVTVTSSNSARAWNTVTRSW